MQAGNLTKADVFGKTEHIFDHIDSLRKKEKSLIDAVPGSEDDYISIAIKAM